MRRFPDLTQGGIVRSIVLFSLPLILGELLQNLYNNVNALVVGNPIDQRALAAANSMGYVLRLIQRSVHP